MSEPVGLGRLGAVDWVVIASFFILVTWVGERMAGKQASMRDFFLGGRKLPWYAVAASIVATEISAVTLVALPAVVFRDGGNLTYLQIGLIGSLLARGAIAWWLVPVYYEREIYSPYDYMARRLGGRVRSLATGLFALGGVLGQSARVYLVAVVLEVVLQRELAWFEGLTGMPPLASCVAAIALVAIVWTWLGGIATVVWTDALLFCVLLAAVVIGLVTAVSGLDGGWSEVVRQGHSAGKWELFDARFSLTRPYTLWAALIAQSWAGIGAYGVDQLMAQRIFCCAGVPEARRAVMASTLGMLVTVLVGVLGVALFAHYAAHPLEGAALELYREKPDRIFVMFVLSEVPTALKGLILAGILAAAISSLDSILAALAQTTMSALWLPRRAQSAGRAYEAGEDGANGVDQAREQRLALRVSRLLVGCFGLLLAGAALGADWVSRHYANLLDLALAMAGYTQGALLAGLLLALGKRGERARSALGRGFLWAAPLSVLTVFALAWSPLVARALFAALWVAVLLGWWMATPLRGVRRSRALLSASALGVLLAAIQLSGFRLAWSWYALAGCASAYLLTLLLAPAREAELPPPASGPASMA